MQAKGVNSKLIIDFEETFGQNPAAANGLQMPFNSVSVSSKQNLIDPGTITGSRNAVEPAKGNIDVTGGVTVPVDLRAFGYWLKGCFNSPVTTGSAVPYTHKFKIGATQPSMVIEKQFPDVNKYMLANGLKINSLKLSFGGDGELTADFELIGAKESLNSTPYDDTPIPVVLHRVGNFQAKIKENGVELANVTQGDFTINFGLDNNQYVIGSGGTRGDIPEGMVKISGNIKTLFSDSVMLDKAVNGTKSNLEIEFIDGNQSLGFMFPEVIYERQTPGISGPAGVLVELNFQAFHATDVNKSAVVVTLKNDQPVI